MNTDTANIQKQTRFYSQNAEEKAILDYFGAYVGTFIDIGANDGVTLSNTRRLFELGWKGVCVEPSPQAFKRLKELYSKTTGIYTYNFAISDHNGKEVLHESGPLLGKDDIGLVSTSNREEMDRFAKSVTYTPVEVKCFRWKTFINRCTIKDFDFVSIDTEGNDLTILQQMDLSKVKCICLEWNGSPTRKQSFEAVLDGFKLIYTSPENLIYARPNL